MLKLLLSEAMIKCGTSDKSVISFIQTEHASKSNTSSVA